MHPISPCGTGMILVYDRIRSSTYTVSLAAVTNPARCRRASRLDIKLLRLHSLWGALDRVRLGVDPATFDVDAPEHGYREPYHDNEEEKRVANVAGAVSDEADDERADERARLSCL